MFITEIYTNLAMPWKVHSALIQYFICHLQCACTCARACVKEMLLTMTFIWMKTTVIVYTYTGDHKNSSISKCNLLWTIKTKQMEFICDSNRGSSLYRTKRFHFIYCIGKTLYWIRLVGFFLSIWVGLVNNKWNTLNYCFL